MVIQLLIDNPNSWFVEYGNELVKSLSGLHHDVRLIHDHDLVQSGDLLFILSCEKIVKSETLSRNKLNLVVHGSDLPKGRGMSPLTWEILNGQSEFYLSLLEASLKVDTGKIFMKSSYKLEGHELNEESRMVQGREIIKLVLRFVEKYPQVNSMDQTGEPTYYRWRKPEDSELDINKSINEQFNLLRVVDNERYPAYFIKDGHKYILKIFKASP